MHFPPAQVWSRAQALLQAPQLRRSEARVVQAPAQLVSPALQPPAQEPVTEQTWLAEQALPQPPQLSWMVAQPAALGQCRQSRRQTTWLRQ